MSLAFEQPSSGEKQMRLREHAAVKGKGDYLWIDPRKLKVDPAFNVRDMESADTKAHIAWLKSLIIANGGVATPLEVRLEGKDIFVTAGHCRRVATIQAIEEGHPIATVPCLQEPKGTSEIDRVVNLVVSNSGKPLGPLEIAKVVKRLKGFGWADKAIAERLGWKSPASVKQHLEMLELSEPVKRHIRAGTVSATTARHLAKSDLSPEEQDALLRANEEENARIKGKRTRVTPRQVRAATRPKPPAAPAPAPAEPPLQPSPAPAEAQAETVCEQEPAATPSMVVGVADLGPTAAVESGPERMTEAELEQGLVDQGLVPPLTAPLPTDAPVQLRPAPDEAESVSIVTASRQGIKDLVDALAPFAKTVEENDLSERSNDDVIEVRVGDLKRAWTVWNRSAGDDVKSAA